MSSDVSLRPLGLIARLQIQRTPLTFGERPHRYYDPAPLLSVDELTLTPHGALVRLAEGGTLLDIHHAHHPQTRNDGGTNALSVGFTAHYAAIRARYGDDLADGCAGENILVETETMVDLNMLARGLAIQPAGGGSPAWLQGFQVARPCHPFSGYVRHGTEAKATKETLQFLDHGLRGFYCGLAEGVVTVAVGDQVLVPPGPSQLELPLR